MKIIPVTIAAVITAIAISVVVVRETTHRLDVPAAETVASVPVRRAPQDPVLPMPPASLAESTPPSVASEPQGEPQVSAPEAPAVSEVPDPNNTNLAEVRTAIEGRSERNLHSRGSDGQHAE